MSEMNLKSKRDGKIIPLGKVTLAIVLTKELNKLKCKRYDKVNVSLIGNQILIEKAR